jgi:DeoR family transcriptional regulator, aga operon transcriptional repressor
MNMEQRREKIVSLVNREGSVSFAKLKETFRQVSEMTLRRDLEYLDTSKRIIRTHGGARSVEVLIGTDDLYLKRTTRNADEKKLIAEKAVSLLHENTTIFLDSGSTCTEFARHIPDGPYMIFTTSLSGALELARLQQAQVHLIGGHMNAPSLSLKGAMTVRDLAMINFHTAFIGVTGYIQSRGFTCGSTEECELKRTAMAHSEKSVMLMDAQKVGVTSTFTFAEAEDADVVVSDGALDEKTLREFERAGVIVL